MNEYPYSLQALRQVSLAIVNDGTQGEGREGTHLSNVEGPCMRPPAGEVDCIGGMLGGIDIRKSNNWHEGRYRKRLWVCESLLRILTLKVRCKPSSDQLH